MPTLKKRANLLALITILLVIRATGCTAAPGPETAASPPLPVKIKLTWYHGTQFLGFYVAQAQGYYAEEGLEVTIIERTKEDQNITEQVATGEYDFIVGGSVGPSQADGVPVTAIAAMYQFGPDAFFARADSGIVTPADLAGRTIAVKSPGWERMLKAILREGGLTMDDVQPMPAGFDMTPFFNGEIDVWAGFLNDEVVRARQAGLELVTLPLYEYGISTVAQTVATSRDSLATEPELAERFLRASLRGWQWAVEHPTESVDLMIELHPEMAADRDCHLAAFDASIPLVQPPDTRLGTIDCDRWNQSEVLAQVETTEGFCTTAILEAAWQEIDEGQ